MSEQAKKQAKRNVPSWFQDVPLTLDGPCDMAHYARTPSLRHLLPRAYRLTPPPKRR